MTTMAALQSSASFLLQLANPAARALALGAVAGLGLAAFRVRSTSVRLFTWTGVLYAALALPLLGWLLPPLPVPTPSFLRSAFLHRVAVQVVPKDVQSAQPVVTTPVPAAAGDVFIARNEAVTGGSPATGSRPQVTHAANSASVKPAATPEVLHPVGVAESGAATSPSFPSFLSFLSTMRGASIPWDVVATGIYLAVTLLFLVRFIVGLALGRRLMRASPVIEEPRVTQRLASRSYASGLAFVPRAAESEFISVPVTMGALRSTILLPLGWREWDDAKLDAVIAHEMSHVARRDALTQRLALLHRAIFWFSPLAWWLDRHLADLAEQASDEAALSCGADSKDYARILLGFFEALHTAPGRVWWQGVSMAKAGQAEQRVEKILSWKGSVAMRLKKSIVVVVVTLAVPVVYLAASARPASYTPELQLHHFERQQTPPPAPSSAVTPKAEPSVAPEPTPASGMTLPPAAPSSQSEPALAPTAIQGTIRGQIYGVPPVPPAPHVAPRIAEHAYPPVGPVSPLAAMPPAAIWSGQSKGSGTSHRGYSYHYGYDDEQRFVIVSGKTDSYTMSGSSEDIRHIEKLKKSIPGDFIWFQRDEKSYIIRDQATIDRARAFWAPQEELGKKQEELGRQQEALGKQQEELSAKMEQIQVNVPDMTAELDKLKAELKALGSGATLDQIGHIQSEMGELQSKLGEVQSHAGEKQGKLGEEMGALGEKQGKLGEQQGELGQQQGELAEKATRQMKQLLDEAIIKGTAQPEP